MSDNRPSAYLESAEDGVYIVLRASGLGGCMRDLVLHLLGNEPLATPDEVQARFDAGNRAEPHILRRCVEEHGFRFVEGSSQREGEYVVIRSGEKPGVKVRFHPDGIADVGEMLDRRVVVEAKALAESSYNQAVSKGTGSLFGYDWQLSAMMHSANLPAVWVALLKNKDQDAEEWDGPMHMEWVDVPPRSKAEFLKRAKMIRDAYLSGEAPECDSPNQYPCPFLYLRPEREDTTEHEGDELVSVAIAQYAQQYDQWAAEEKIAKQNREKARDELLAILNGRGGIRGNGWRVTQHERVYARFDRKAAEKELGDLSRFDSTTSSVSIKVKKVDE